MSKLIDLTGQKFGRLTVLERAPNDAHNKALWRCRCECGNTKPVNMSSLRRGLSRSCGCARDAANRTRFTTHGLSKTKQHHVWESMHARCYCVTDRAYSRYGGRGITVCDRWRNSFENFLADMGEKPSAKHSLDRIDNSGPYSPENCRWATQHEQANNKRNNRVITHDRLTMTLSQWERHLGYRLGTIRMRLHRGWSERKALTTPVRR